MYPAQSHTDALTALSFVQVGSDVKWVVCTTQLRLYMRPFGQNGYILVAFSAPPRPSLSPRRIEGSNVFRVGLAQPHLVFSPM